MTARVEFDVTPLGGARVIADLSTDEVREYLELHDDKGREKWVDARIERWIDGAWLEPVEWEVDGTVALLDLPESVDDLPPAVHPDQSTIFDALEVQS